MGRGLGLLSLRVLAVGKDKRQAWKPCFLPDASESQGTWEGDKLTGFSGQDHACVQAHGCAWTSMTAVEYMCVATCVRACVSVYV